VPYEPDLTHAEARAIVDRAIAKGRELKQAGAFAVMDAGGNLICLSRMGEAPMSAAWVARAKAYVSATQRVPSASAATRWQQAPALFASAQRMARDAIVPEPGAMPVKKGGRVVGALAAGGIGPWTEIPGVDASLLRVDGHRANVEDLIIAHGLQVRYESQHSELQDAREVGPGVDERMDDLPHCLNTARRYADAVIEAGRVRGQHHFAVVVLDEVGQIMQVDRLDGGTMMSPDVAEAKASTALNFLSPSRSAVRLTPQVQAGLRSFVGTRLHFVGGGVPIMREGYVVGAIGISHGGGTESEHELACLGIAKVEGTPPSFGEPEADSHSAQQLRGGANTSSS
jgi:uncharacterized protein GlcG (DUF336 family)